MLYNILGIRPVALNLNLAARVAGLVRDTSQPVPLTLFLSQFFHIVSRYHVVLGLPPGLNLELKQDFEENAEYSILQ